MKVDWEKIFKDRDSKLEQARADRKKQAAQESGIEKKPWIT